MIWKREGGAVGESESTCVCVCVCVCPSQDRAQIGRREAEEQRRLDGRETRKGEGADRVCVYCYTGGERERVGMQTKQVFVFQTGSKRFVPHPIPT